MRLYKDGEISSSGYNYVIIKNLVGEGSVTWVCADMGCGASAGIIPYAAVLSIGQLHRESGAVSRYSPSNFSLTSDAVL